MRFRVRLHENYLFDVFTVEATVTRKLYWITFYLKCECRVCIQDICLRYEFRLHLIFAFDAIAHYLFDNDETVTW